MRAWKLALTLLVLSGGQLLCTRAPEAERKNEHEKPPPPQRERRSAPTPGPSSRVEPPGSDEIAPWSRRLAAQLAKAGYVHPTPSATPLAPGGTPEVGVYVRHLGTGAAFSLRADEPWYLASGIKVPVAIAVLQKTERGELGLESRLRLEATDRVDGTGRTHQHPTHAHLRVDYLLEQMLVYSDNTATDLLIRHVGLEDVNRWARRLSGWDFRITTMADVRRKTYGAFHVKGAELAFDDWVALRRTLAAGQNARGALLSRLIGVSPEELSVDTLDGAFEGFYAEGHNSAPLRAYGELLARIIRGRAVGEAGTAYLLRTMARIQTGKMRLRASLPPEITFAHKTGTQHRRVCDLGMTLPHPGNGSPPAPVVITACTRGFPSVAAAEQALRDVGAAVTASGVLDSTPQAQKPPSPRRDRERLETGAPASGVGRGHPVGDSAGVELRQQAAHGADE